MKLIGMIIFLFFITIYGFDALACQRYSQAEQEQIQSITRRQIAILNDIVQDPKATTKFNWHLIGNPHSELEESFSVALICNETASCYEDESIGRQIRSNEISAVLQYLRLSLLVFNKRPGKIPPGISIDTISLKKATSGQNDVVIAAGQYYVYNAMGYRFAKRIEVTFQAEYVCGMDGKNLENINLYLTGVYVDSKKVFGWWDN